MQDQNPFEIKQSWSFPPDLSCLNFHVVEKVCQTKEVEQAFFNLLGQTEVTACVLGCMYSKCWCYVYTSFCTKVCTLCSPAALHTTLLWTLPWYLKDGSHYLDRAVAGDQLLLLQDGFFQWCSLAICCQLCSLGPFNFLTFFKAVQGMVVPPPHPKQYGKTKCRHDYTQHHRCQYRQWY